MAESFLFPIAGKILEVLGSSLIQTLISEWGTKDELEKFENTLSAIRAVLLDADEKQDEVGNHQLKDWRGKLEVALSKADDVLDDFQIHALHRQVLQENILGKVQLFFSSDSNKLVFRFKMCRKIKRLRERFDEIASDRTMFNLTTRLAEKQVVHREMTHSFVNESNVIGRSHDKENIKQLLMNSANYEKLQVIPIIGIGGVGKTTLVKMVYNDNEVVNHFDLRIWVCISYDFVLRNIIIEILKSIASGDYNYLGIEQLQVCLRRNLHNKTLLLVLDDVWNEKRDKWIELTNLLTGAAEGSKVIVTSRSNLVAEVFAPLTCKYELEALSDQDCLSIFLNWAFWEGEEAKEKHPNLVKIGCEIVKKCKGVPLAVRTLGKLLYMKREEHHWVYVRDNEIWELEQEEGDIMPALKLSYYQLPSHLKQCFAYCSLFPKDYSFRNVELVELWRAQGLIRLEKNKGSVEVGKEYIQSLFSRGFFQEHIFYGAYNCFKMHDLIHDLALYVANPYCITKGLGSTCDTYSSSKVQNLSLMEDNSRSNQIPNGILQSKHQLHSFLLFRNTLKERCSSSDTIIETSIATFKHLRVLYLRYCRCEELPSSIGSLRYLRYLNISCSPYIKSLPDSICNLVLLETLKLWGCTELEKLPQGLGKLIRLKCLYVTTKERCLPEKEIRCLSSLQLLWIYECQNMEFLLSNDGMKCLTSLQRLAISGCGSLVSLPTRGLRNLKELRKVTIENCGELDLLMDGGEAGGGLIGLHFLGIYQLKRLVTLPLWLVQGADALKHIIISDCPNFKTLMPEQLPLGNLKSLQLLWINRCPEMKSLLNGTHHLTSLHEIIVLECPELVSNCKRETGKDWQKISHVPNVYLDGIKI